MAKKKNISKKVKNGTVVISDDKYFSNAHGYSKPRRRAVVIDSNSKDDLAVVKLTTSVKHSKPIFNSVTGPSRFKPGEVYVIDDENNPIKLDTLDVNGNQKFKLFGKKLPKKYVSIVKRICMTDIKSGPRNQRLLRKLKCRKKK